MGKRFVLLAAYEELTEKETFCIKEANLDAIRKIQAKKRKLLRELEALGDGDRLDAEAKADFNRRIESLRQREADNEASLEQQIRQNRTEFKSIAKHTSSVNRIKKAYGAASSPDAPRGSLKNKA